MSIVIFTKNQCLNCYKSKAFLNLYNLKYKEFEINNSVKYKEFPIISIGTNYIYGYRDLINKHESFEFHEFCKKINIHL